MFSDGIRPGCDLADLDTNWNAGAHNNNAVSVSPSTPSTSKTAAASIAKQIAKAAPAAVAAVAATASQPATKLVGGGGSGGSGGRLPTQQQQRATNPNLPPVDAHTRSYIPRAGTQLPPICLDPMTDGTTTTTTTTGAGAGAEMMGAAGGGGGGGVSLLPRYAEVRNDAVLIGRLQRGEQLRFAVQRNLYVLVRIVTREYPPPLHSKPQYPFNRPATSRPPFGFASAVENCF